MLSNYDKTAVQLEVHRLYTLASSKLKLEFPLPDISFRRSGKNAGTAFLHQNRINFHPILFRENKAAFYSDVIPHEVSHLITFHRFGRVKPHGSEWQWVMSDIFHVSPSTTHNFDITSLGIKTFSYQCGCGDVSLSIRRHNNALQGTKYRCRRCKETLRFIKDV